MDQIAKLIAEKDIQDCLKRYARGVDRKDWKLVRGCFYPNAIDHHGDFHGTVEEFIEWVTKRHKHVPFSMHYLLNCLVDFKSDATALVETYFWAIQRREPEEATVASKGTDHEVFGRYVDRFERRNGEWRIADRKVVYDSTRQTDSTHHVRKLVGILGQRDESDEIYRTEIIDLPGEKIA